MSEAVDPIRGARERVADVAATIAESIHDSDDEQAAALRGQADAVKSCAEAVSAVAFGSDGGEFSSTRDDRYAYTYPDAARRGATGFGAHDRDHGGRSEVAGPGDP